MTQEGGNQDGAQESHDRATSAAADTPAVGSTTKTGSSNSCDVKSVEAANAAVKLESPAAPGKGKSSAAGVVNGVVEAGGEGGGGGSGSRSKPPKKSSSDVVGGDRSLKANKDSSGAGGGGRCRGKSRSAARVEHELHIWTERERRKKMKNMFSSLHSLLPQLPDRADKASIVGEAITYIKTLEDTLKKLEKIKLERMCGQQQQQRAGSGGGQASGPAALSAAAPPPTTREAALADMARGWNARHVAGAGGAGSAAAAATAPAPAPFQTWSGPNVVLNMAGDDAFITLSTPRQLGAFSTVLFVLEKHRIDVVTSTVSSELEQKLFNLHVRVRESDGVSGQSSESQTPEDKYKLALSEIMLWLNN